MRITIILFIALINCRHGFSRNHDQEVDSVFFDIYVDSEDLIKGQCTILSAAILAKNVESIGLQFHDLGKQASRLQTLIKSYFPFFGNNNIESLNGESVNIDGLHYIKYKFIELAVCPNENVKIPSLPIELLIVKDSSIVTLWSNELEISTSPKDLGTTLEKNNLNYQLVGHFDSKISSGEIQSTIGDTTNLIFEVSGEGNLLPLTLPNVDNEGFKMIPYVQSFKDTIIDYTYWNRKVFNLEIISKKQGDYDLDRLLDIQFYSTQEDDFKNLTSDVSIRISGKNVNPTKIDDPNLVLLLDISQSMDLEDYYFNRLERAIRIINDFLDHSCYPLYTISGQALRYNSCEIDRQVVSNRTRGTSIGNGLWFALEYLRYVEKEKRGIVLISDGDITRSNVRINTTSDLAKKMGVKIYTVGIGSHGKAPYGTDLAGRTRYIENTFDDTTLKDISQVTGGKYYHLPVNSDGKEIINEILNQLK